MVADLKCDFGNADFGFEEFALRPLDAAAIDVICQGEAGGFLEETAEVGFAETGLPGDERERQWIGERGFDELLRFYDRCGSRRRR